MTDNGALKAPFPWFGGKSRAAGLIWQRLGKVNNYVEPFAGSLAVLLGAPRVARYETINDLDGFVSNFWRALQHDPEAVAHHADWPVNETDLHARHVWLLNRREDLTARLMGDPDFCDVKIAGWWAWGLSCWIGSGFCSGGGPWQSVDGRFAKVEAGAGVWRQRQHLGRDQGVHSQAGVWRTLPHLCEGQGVHSQAGVWRKLPDIKRAKGVNRDVSLVDWFASLANRLRRVRVSCGDWSRVLGPSPTTKLGLTAVVLDPPYSTDERDPKCYSVAAADVAADVRRWALENGDNPLLRIALCGYDTEHTMPGWTAVGWKALGGYGSQGEGRGRENASRETVWFSPHCLGPKQGTLF